MQIKIFKDLKKYTLTSNITKEDIELVKKHRPLALKKQDKDGNDVFAISYNEGHPCVGEFGVTFGSVASEGGNAMCVFDLPEKIPQGMTAADIAADKVGCALDNINEFEASIPAIAAEIAAARAELIGNIEEA